MSKKANGEGSIFKTRSGKWRAVMSLGKDASGKRIRQYRTFDKKADAVAAMRGMQGNSTLAVHKAAGTTVSEALDLWLKLVVKPNLAQNTLISYTRISNDHIKPYLGNVSLRDLDPIGVEGLLTSLLADEIGDRSRQLAYVVLNRCLGKFLEWRKILFNPCSCVQRPTYERAEIFPFDEDQARMILSESQGTREHAMYYLALSMGIRQGELLGLMWEKIDWKAESIRIDLQAIEDKAAKVTLAPPKTKYSFRTIAIPEPAVDALHRHKAICLKEGLAKNPLVFPAISGEPRTKSYFINRVWNKFLARLQEQYKINPRGFHHTRHTYATLSLSAGVPVHVVSKVMGHSSPAITWKIYAHLMPKDQDAAKEKITGILRGGCSVAAPEFKKTS